MKKPKSDSRNKFTKTIDQQVDRKIKARENERHSIWFGLGMFGLIGWSVTIPTVAGIALGLWMDKRWPGQISWALTMMFVGVVIGCLNAWRWIKEESRDE